MAESNVKIAFRQRVMWGEEKRKMTQDMHLLLCSPSY